MDVAQCGEPRRKQTRRPFQFRLDTMFLVVTVCAVWLGLEVALIRARLPVLAITGLSGMGAILGIGVARRSRRVLFACVIAGAIGGAVPLMGLMFAMGMFQGFWLTFDEGSLPPRLAPQELVVLLFVVAASAGAGLGAVVGLVYGLCAWDVRKRGIVYTIRGKE